MEPAFVLQMIFIFALGLFVLRFMFRTIFADAIADRKREKEEREERRKKRQAEAELREKEKKERWRKWQEEHPGMHPRYYDHPRRPKDGDLPF